MLSIRAATKKNLELAASAFKFDEEYIQKGKFEVEYLTLINDITKKLALQPEIKINGLNFNTKDDEFKGVLDVSLTDAEDYILLKKNLSDIESIKSVLRGSGV